MANLNTHEVTEMLSPWLSHALRHYFDFYEGTASSDSYDFLAELPVAEYVSIVHPYGELSPDDDLPTVDRYPGDRVAYDDLYERLLSGCSVGGTLRIYKSTGEIFTPSESRSVRAGIRNELLWGITDDGDDIASWEIDVHAEGQVIPEGFEDEDFDRVIVVEVQKVR